MFDDCPPPYPPPTRLVNTDSITTTNVTNDCSGIADLNDTDRFTAVADYDDSIVQGLVESTSSPMSRVIMPSIPASVDVLYNDISLENAPSVWLKSQRINDDNTGEQRAVVRECVAYGKQLDVNCDGRLSSPVSSICSDSFQVYDSDKNEDDVEHSETNKTRVVYHEVIERTPELSSIFASEQQGDGEDISLPRGSSALIYAPHSTSREHEFTKEEEQVQCGRPHPFNPADEGIMSGSCNDVTIMPSVITNGKCCSNNDDDDDFGEFETFHDYAEMKPESISGCDATELIQSSEVEAQDKSRNDAIWVADFSSNNFEGRWGSNKEISSLVIDENTFIPVSENLSTVKECGFEFDVSDITKLNDFCGSSSSFWFEEQEAGENLILSELESSSSGIVEALNEICVEIVQDGSSDSIWLATSIVEEANALKFQWFCSTSRVMFLDALRVNEKLAVVKESNLPVFAQHLDERKVLLPTYACNVSDKISSDTEMPSNRIDGVQQHSSSSPVHINSLSVPPAQFDWCDSGLTNPLTFSSISATSTILDLDYLASASQCASADTNKFSADRTSSALQKDLAVFGLDYVNISTDASSQTVTNVAKKLSIIDELMKQNKHPERRYASPKELSLDAIALHDQLPDLDYMLADVLLFPQFER